MPSLVLLQRDHEASPHLAALIAATPGFRVVGTVHTIDEARPLIARADPDILVTDLRVQDGPVDGLLGDLRQGGRATRPQVLVTLMSHDDMVLLQALRAGADGWAEARGHGPAAGGRSDGGDLGHPARAVGRRRRRAIHDPEGAGEWLPDQRRDAP